MARSLLFSVRTEDERPGAGVPLPARKREDRAERRQRRKTAEEKDSGERQQRKTQEKTKKSPAAICRGISVCSTLLLYYVSCLLAASTLNDIVGYSLTLFQSLEAIALDSGEMYEYILSILTGDEAIAFLRIEPLNSTLVHCWDLQKNI